MQVRKLIPFLLVATVTISGCSDDLVPTTAVIAAPEKVNSQGAVKFWESGSSVYWNGVARSLVVKYRSSPFAAIRGYALVSHAQYNAVLAAKSAKGSMRPSSTAATARASAITLAYLYPAEASNLENLVATQLASADWPGNRNTDLAAGEVVGRAIGEQIVADARTDRFFAPWTGTVPTGPGLWFSTSTPPAPPIGPMFGSARTYFLTSGDQFRPPPPPAFGSAEYAAALAEVRLVSDTRTAAQTANAQFWALEAGTVTPPGFWNIEASKLVVSYHLTERDAAHVLALMNMTGFDAIVACHDAKYAYWFIRPTQADPLITLAVGLPNFPSYPSNHACISGAQTTVLGAFFPAEKTRLDAMAEEAAVSRLDGGLHYRFDNDTGLTLGRKVADLSLSLDRH